jgi:hypothetical protein
MTGHLRWNGGDAQAPPPISPRVYVGFVLLQLLFLGSALLTWTRSCATSGVPSRPRPCARRRRS